MSQSRQFDPALKQLLLQETGSPLGESIPEAIGAREVPVVARLIDPALAVEGLNGVTHFGPVVTGRVRLDCIVALHNHPNIASLKASNVFGSALAVSVPEIRASADLLREATPPMGVTGRGVAIGFADWGCDFAHVNLRNLQGGTRLLCLWDQRGGTQPDSPQPFGYGRLFSREQIDAALAQPNPYVTLGYDPAQSDDGTGTHCTHVMDIAAGSGLAPGSSPGVAPEADLICVHLKGDDTRLEDTLGDSVRVLEAVRFIVDCAGDRPVVINLSLGKTGGPHDKTPLVTQALDNLLDEKPGCAVTMSTGNYFSANIHSDGQLRTGERADLRWSVTIRNEKIVEMEVWYSGSDQFDLELIDPFGASLGVVALGEDLVVREGNSADGERIIASIYHRRHDPNNGLHQIDIFLLPDAAIGTWTTRLHGKDVIDGHYHAWIERDRPSVQARFESECSTPTYTTGTICNGLRTIAVGAYDARRPTHPLAPFSSAGPTRDDRAVPLVSAPGVAIRAARSSYPTSDGRQINALTVKSGTSMAAPHVSGVVALMFEAAGNWRLTAEQTREILIATARAAPGADPYGRYGAGRVDAAAAVKRVLALKPGHVHQALQPEPVLVPARTTQEQEKAEMEIQEGLAQIEQAVLNFEVVEVAETTDVVSATIDLFGESCDERFRIIDTTESLDAMQLRLAPILPELLVAQGETELHRRDESGDLIYDKCQPVFFGPNGRSYATGPGQFNYHAADFVYNTAYDLGYDVPVYTPNANSPSDGEAYLNLAATFKALAEGDGDLRTYLDRFFDIVARPGESAPPDIQAGDLLLRGAQSDANYGHLAIVVNPQLRDLDDPFFLGRDRPDGKGLHCISAGLAIQNAQGRCGHALTDGQGNLLDNRMVIRLKESTIDPSRAASRLDHDPDYRHQIEHAYWAANLNTEAGTSSEEDAAEAVPDTAVVVPTFTTAKRAVISMPLLNAAQNAAAITWNMSKHPGLSGVSPDDIRSALASYVDFATVAHEITHFNAGNSSAPISLGSRPIDAVFVEAVHQFQVKCFVESSQVDGKVGESTLDSLGLVRRTGMNAVDSPNALAQCRLNSVNTSVSNATGGDLSAANWFQNMVNPSFLGRRFSNGIHVVLARKLRVAENSLLGQSAYRGMTPVELGRALGIDEEHKGARPSTRSNSIHTFGLAVDIQYGRNPWVAGQHIDRDSSGNPTTEGQATQRANQEFTAAMNRAVLLISGVTVNFTPNFLHGLRTQPTADIHTTLSQRSADLRAYLRLHNNPAEIQRKITERQAAGTVGVLNPGETAAAASARWQTLMSNDLTNLRRADSNFTGRDPQNGFMNLHRDLVVALRDAAGLAWAAVDIGDRESGDMMHFDDRLAGVGRTAHGSRCAS